MDTTLRSVSFRWFGFGHNKSMQAAKDILYILIHSLLVHKAQIMMSVYLYNDRTTAQTINLMAASG